MKRYLSIVLAIVLALLASAGCAQPTPNTSSAGEVNSTSAASSTSEANGTSEANSTSEAGQERVRVVTTNFAPYDFVREIAGDKADISMLLPPGVESHSFEPTPQDLINIQNSDLFIYVGGEAEPWVEKILESVDTSKTKTVTLTDCVELVEEIIVEGMQDEEHAHTEETAHTEEEAAHAEEEAAHTEEEAAHAEEGAAHTEEEAAHAEEGHAHEGIVYDEHVWTSPKNAKLIVQKLSDALCEADAKNADAYRQSTAAYAEKLDTLDASFQAVVDGAVRKTVVFGDRYPFRYFSDAYGLTYYAAFPGCSTETEAAPQTVQFLMEKVQAEKIPVVFHIELSNEQMADAICEETGAKKLLLHACHNVSKEDFDSGASYLGLMTKNVDALKEALA